MSIYIFRDWDNDLDSLRPSQLLDQHFGLGLTAEDLLSPLTIPRQSQGLLRMPNYYRGWRTPRQNRETGSVVKSDKEQFKVNLDVQQFAPEEIQVKVVDNSIVVEGKHEERQDEHGFVSRQFVRRYILPQDHDIKAVSSSLSSDGILTITAPKLSLEQKEERVIPITHTGPAKNVPEKAEETPKVEKK